MLSQITTLQKKDLKQSLKVQQIQKKNPAQSIADRDALISEFNESGTLRFDIDEDYGIAVKDEGDFIAVNFGSNDLTEIGSAPSGNKAFRTIDEALDFVDDIKSKSTPLPLAEADVANPPLAEEVFYHGTSKENAEGIINNPHQPLYASDKITGDPEMGEYASSFGDTILKLKPKEEIKVFKLTLAEEQKAIKNIDDLPEYKGVGVNGQDKLNEWAKDQGYDLIKITDTGESVILSPRKFDMKKIDNPDLEVTGDVVNPLLSDIDPLVNEARKYKSADEFVKGLQKDYFAHGSRADFDRFDPSRIGSGEGMGGYGFGMSVGDDINFVHANYATKYGEGTGANIYLVPKKGLNIVTPEVARSPDTMLKLANEIKSNPKFNNKNGLVKLADNIIADIKAGKPQQDKYWNEGYMIDLGPDTFGVEPELFRAIGIDGIGDLKKSMSPVYEGLDVSQNTGVTLFEPERFDLIKTSKSQLTDIFNKSKSSPLPQGGVDEISKNWGKGEDLIVKARNYKTEEDFVKAFDAYPDGLNKKSPPAHALLDFEKIYPGEWDSWGDVQTVKGSTEKIDKIYKNFDWGKFDPVLLRKYPNSVDFAVEDGHHRMAGLIKAAFLKGTPYPEGQAYKVPVYFDKDTLGKIWKIANNKGAPSETLEILSRELKGIFPDSPSGGMSIDDAIKKK